MVDKYDFKILDAENVQVPLRLSLDGPSGSGKTMTALKIARRLVGGDMKKVLVIDSENGSSVKYKDQFPGFKIINLTRGMPDDYDPLRYIAAMRHAEKVGFDVVIVDSLSHAWAGPGGALEQVDKLSKAKFGGNSWAAFSEVTPIQNQLINTILNYGPHLIVTMRSKTEYITEKTSTGKTAPKKVGTKPVQREGMDYEFDVVIHMEGAGSVATVTKTRCSALAGKILEYPGEELAETLLEWLSGVDPDTLPMTKERFVDVCAQRFGATLDDIKEALQEKMLRFSFEKSQQLFPIIEDYMIRKAGEAEPEAEPEEDFEPDFEDDPSA